MFTYPVCTIELPELLLEVAIKYNSQPAENVKQRVLQKYLFPFCLNGGTKLLPDIPEICTK